MRNTLTLLSTFIAFGAIAQCSISIAPLSTVVTTVGGLVSANAGTFWVCPGASPTFSGNTNTIAVEDGAVVSISGNDNIVSAKTFLGVSGDDNTIYTTDAALVLDQGSGNTIVQCASVVFDYTNAPTAGCAVGVNEGTASVQVQILSNPVSDLLTITSNGNTIHGVQLIDLLGHVVRYQAGANVVLMDTGDLPAAVYMVQVHTSNGILVRRVVKQ